MNHLTNAEFLSYARSGIKVDVEKLITRFEGEIEEKEELLRKDLVERAEAIKWARSCFEDHAGEGFHADIIENLRQALKENKEDMKLIIKQVIQDLERDDQAAMNSFDYMREGDF